MPPMADFLIWLTAGVSATSSATVSIPSIQVWFLLRFVHTSAGTVINQANLSGAQFGVSESNRTVVAGYIENADFHSLGLSQLIQGLGWLVRDGKSYINQSAQVCAFTRIFHAPRK
jgi:hypothetical protein